MKSKQRRLGFTLIEILLVIAILSVLMAIIFAVVGPAKRMGRVAVCTSNLRQIGLAYQTYLSDYGYYPYPEAITTGSFLKDKRILFCPDDTSDALMGAASSYRYRFELPLDSNPLWEASEVDSNLVLAICDHHLGQNIIYMKNDATARTPPQYPYHLVLRASGAVERVHVSRIRKLHLPGDRPIFMDIYPNEPGYEQAGR